MAFKILIATVMKPYKSGSTLINEFNYLCLHVEGDDYQVALFRCIQVWADMAFTIPIATVMKPYKSESALLNVFNYLRLHVEGDDYQVALLCSNY